MYSLFIVLISFFSTTNSYLGHHERLGLLTGLSKHNADREVCIPTSFAGLVPELRCFVTKDGYRVGISVEVEDNITRYTFDIDPSIYVEVTTNTTRTEVCTFLRRHKEQLQCVIYQQNRWELLVQTTKTELDRRSNYVAAMETIKQHQLANTPYPDFTEIPPEITGAFPENFEQKLKQAYISDSVEKMTRIRVNTVEPKKIAKEVKVKDWKRTEIDTFAAAYSPQNNHFAPLEKSDFVLNYPVCYEFMTSAYFGIETPTANIIKRTANAFVRRAKLTARNVQDYVHEAAVYTSQGVGDATDTIQDVCRDTMGGINNALTASAETIQSMASSIEDTFHASLYNIFKVSRKALDIADVYQTAARKLIDAHTDKTFVAINTVRSCLSVQKCSFYYLNDMKVDTNETMPYRLGNNTIPVWKDSVHLGQGLAVMRENCAGVEFFSDHFNAKVVDEMESYGYLYPTEHLLDRYYSIDASDHLHRTFYSDLPIIGNRFLDLKNPFHGFLHDMVKFNSKCTLLRFYYGDYYYFNTRRDFVGYFKTDTIGLKMMLGNLHSHGLYDFACDHNSFGYRITRLDANHRIGTPKPSEDIPIFGDNEPETILETKIGNHWVPVSMLEHFRLHLLHEYADLIFITIIIFTWLTTLKTYGVNIRGMVTLQLMLVFQFVRYIYTDYMTIIALFAGIFMWFNHACYRLETRKEAFVYFINIMAFAVNVAISYTNFSVEERLYCVAGFIVFYYVLQRLWRLQYRKAINIAHIIESHHIQVPNYEAALEMGVILNRNSNDCKKLGKILEEHSTFGDFVATYHLENFDIDAKFLSNNGRLSAATRCEYLYKEYACAIARMFYARKKDAKARILFIPRIQITREEFMTVPTNIGKILLEPTEMNRELMERLKIEESKDFAPLTTVIWQFIKKIGKFLTRRRPVVDRPEARTSTLYMEEIDYVSQYNSRIFSVNILNKGFPSSAFAFLMKPDEMLIQRHFFLGPNKYSLKNEDEYATLHEAVKKSILGVNDNHTINARNLVNSIKEVIDVAPFVPGQMHWTFKVRMANDIPLAPLTFSNRPGCCAMLKLRSATLQLTKGIGYTNGKGTHTISTEDGYCGSILVNNEGLLGFHIIGDRTEVPNKYLPVEMLKQSTNATNKYIDIHGHAAEGKVVYDLTNFKKPKSIRIDMDIFALTQLVYIHKSDEEKTKISATDVERLEADKFLKTQESQTTANSIEDFDAVFSFMEMEERIRLKNLGAKLLNDVKNGKFKSLAYLEEMANPDIYQFGLSLLNVFGYWALEYVEIQRFGQNLRQPPYVRTWMDKLRRMFSSQPEVDSSNNLASSVHLGLVSRFLNDMKSSQFVNAPQYVELKGRLDNLGNPQAETYQTDVANLLNDTRSYYSTIFNQLLGSKLQAYAEDPIVKQYFNTEKLVDYLVKQKEFMRLYREDLPEMSLDITFEQFWENMKVALFMPDMEKAGLKDVLTFFRTQFELLELGIVKENAKNPIYQRALNKIFQDFAESGPNNGISLAKELGALVTVTEARSNELMNYSTTDIDELEEIIAELEPHIALATIKKRMVKAKNRLISDKVSEEKRNQEWMKDVARLNDNNMGQALRAEQTKRVMQRAMATIVDSMLAIEKLYNTGLNDITALNELISNNGYQKVMNIIDGFEGKTYDVAKKNGRLLLTGYIHLKKVWKNETPGSDEYKYYFDNFCVDSAEYEAKRIIVGTSFVTFSAPLEVEILANNGMVAMIRNEKDLIDPEMVNPDFTVHIPSFGGAKILAIDGISTFGDSGELYRKIKDKNFLSASHDYAIVPLIDTPERGSGIVAGIGDVITYSHDGKFDLPCGHTLKCTLNAQMPNHVHNDWSCRGSFSRAFRQHIRGLDEDNCRGAGGVSWITMGSYGLPHRCTSSIEPCRIGEMMEKGKHRCNFDCYINLYTTCGKCGYCNNCINAIGRVVGEQGCTSEHYHGQKCQKECADKVCSKDHPEVFQANISLPNMTSVVRNGNKLMIGNRVILIKADKVDDPGFTPYHGFWKSVSAPLARLDALIKQHFQIDILHPDGCSCQNCVAKRMLEAVDQPSDEVRSLEHITVPEARKGPAKPERNVLRKPREPLIHEATCDKCGVATSDVLGHLMANKHFAFRYGDELYDQFQTIILAQKLTSDKEVMEWLKQHSQHLNDWFKSHTSIVADQNLSKAAGRC